MFEAKEALENRIKEHRESIKKARAIENEIGVSFWSSALATAVS